MKDKLIKEYLFLFLSIFLAGCSDPAMEEFERLCAEEAEENIGEPIEVEGFFFASEDDCGGCTSKLGPGGFKYIEWLNTKHSRRMGELKLDTYYRIYKAPKDNPYCNWVILKDRKDVDFCIATEPVDELISIYSYRYDIGMYKRIGNSEIWEHYEELIRINLDDPYFQKRFKLFYNTESAFNPARSVVCEEMNGNENNVGIYGRVMKSKR